ncbi:DUF2993 domain-containing protein [Nitriliruptoraceae bacterium ZYF776]|nr:DUF2993 domain-containing protein [Profundirhabdus halotolerans]
MGEAAQHAGDVVGVEEAAHGRPPVRDGCGRRSAGEERTRSSFPASRDRSLKEPGRSFRPGAPGCGPGAAATVAPRAPRLERGGSRPRGPARGSSLPRHLEVVRVVEATVIVVVVVAVVVALLAASAGLAEAWLRTRGLDRLRRAVAAELGTRPELVSVEVDASRLLPIVVARRETRVRVRADEVPMRVDDARLRHLEVTLHGVRVVGWRGHLRLIVDGGRFVAELDERELPSLLPLRGVVTRTEVQEGGLRLWTVAAVPVDADVIVTGESLIIQPDPAQLSKLLELPGLRAARRFVPEARLRVPLPELPMEASIREVGFRAGSVEIRGMVPPQELHRDGHRVRARRPA